MFVDKHKIIWSTLAFTVLHRNAKRAKLETDFLDNLILFNLIMDKIIKEVKTSGRGSRMKQSQRKEKNWLSSKSPDNVNLNQNI